MIKVEIHISGGIPDHRFVIDGETISVNSPITSFIHKPFSEWKERLLEEIIEENNRDQFELYIESSEEEYTFLKNQASKCELCLCCERIGVIPEEIMVNSGTVDSWGKMNALFERYGNRIAKTEKIVFGLLIPSEYENCYIGIRDSLVSCGFSSSSMNLRKAYFNISLEEIDEEDIPYFEGNIISYKKEMDSPDSIVIDSNPEDFGKELLSCIEKKYVIPFLEKNQHVEDDEKIPKNENNRALDIVISIPSQMDKGKIAQVVITGAPRTEILQSLRCEIDNNDVVKYENGTLKAIGAGQATVKFSVIGKIEYISKQVVTVIEHILVERIELNQDCFEGLVGDSFVVSAKCFPEYSENVTELKYESLTPDIVTINSKGVIEAIGNGQGRVRAYIGSVEAVANISITNRLTKIDLSKKEYRMYLGETEKVKLSISPSLYTEDSIEIKSNNDDIAFYKSGKIVAQGIGETDISFKSKNSNVENSLHVIVQSTFQKRDYSSYPVQVGILLFIISAICTFVVGKAQYGLASAIAGLALCIVSLIFDRKDKVFSIIFAMLNAGLIYYLFR